VEQIILLSLVGAVGTGLVAVTVSALNASALEPPVVRPFLANLLLFNLLILGGLILRYLLLPPPSRPPVDGALVFGLLIVMNALKLAWLGAFVTLVRALSGGSRVAASRRTLAFAATALLVAWLVMERIGGVAARISGIGFEGIVVGAALAASLRLVSRARSIGASPRRRSLLAFGGFHAALFAVLMVSLAVGWLRAAGPPGWLIVSNNALLIAFNCFPPIWFRRFPLRGPAGGSVDGDRFGLTPREREIVELICTGRTNREIAERLFISLATVKDHNYHIFRKTGVRNRVELVNLFREPGPG
jgi:DNA-binding CsgD family transcriptional regulator